MKILFVNPKQFGHSAGHYFYCKYLKDEYNIFYLCFDKGLRKVRIPGVKVSYVKHSKYKIITAFRLIKKSVELCKENDVKILFVSYFQYSMILSLLNYNKIKILDIRSVSVAKNKIKRWILNKLILINSLFFSNIIVLSKYLSSDLGIWFKRPHIVPLGAEKYSEGKKSFNEMKLLYVGALNSRKIHQTIEGSKFFLDQNNIDCSFSYKIIGFGDESEEKKILDVINEKNLKGKISFLGRKTYDQLKPYFIENNIGVSWIPINEIFNYQPPTKTFEYIISGMYCIGTSTAANADIINNDNGCLCNDNPKAFADALFYTYSNLNKLESDRIERSLSSYQWKNIINHNLKPFIKKIQKN
jgi:hypothetical protein